MTEQHGGLVAIQEVPARILADEARPGLIFEVELEILEDEVADEKVVRTDACDAELCRLACLADPIPDCPEICRRVDSGADRVRRLSGCGRRS